MRHRRQRAPPSLRRQLSASGQAMLHASLASTQRRATPAAAALLRDATQRNLAAASCSLRKATLAKNSRAKREELQHYMACCEHLLRARTSCGARDPRYASITDFLREVMVEAEALKAARQGGTVAAAATAAAASVPSAPRLSFGAKGMKYKNKPHPPHHFSAADNSTLCVSMPMSSDTAAGVFHFSVFIFVFFFNK